MSDERATIPIPPRTVEESAPDAHLHDWSSFVRKFVFEDGSDEQALQLGTAFARSVKKEQLALIMWFLPFANILRGINAKNHQRNARLDALEARLATLEQRPKGLRYRGVWAAGEQYEEGDFVTCGGSMWACKQPHVGFQPGHESSAVAWQLAVKKGKDGKDARGR